MIVENLFEISSLTDLDKTIETRLKEAGIILLNSFTKPEENEEGIIKMFKEEFLWNHPLTIKEHLFLTLDPMLEVLSEVKKIPGEYVGYILMLKGYCDARSELNFKELTEKFATPSQYLKKLNNIFSDFEFTMVAEAVEALIPQFQKTATDCSADFARDRSIEEKQSGFIAEFVHELSRKGAHKNTNVIAGRMSERLMEIASKTDKPTLLQLWTKSHKEKIWGSPLDRLTMHYVKLTLYWQLLHHAGYARLPVGKNESHKWVKFL